MYQRVETLVSTRRDVSINTQRHKYLPVETLLCSFENEYVLLKRLIIKGGALKRKRPLHTLKCKITAENFSFLGILFTFATVLERFED